MWENQVGELLVTRHLLFKICYVKDAFEIQVETWTK